MVVAQKNPYFQNDRVLKMSTIKKLFDLLSDQERKRAALLVGMILVMALLDVLGVASIMPFMAVLASPQMVETNPILKVVYAWLDFNDHRDFLFAMGVAVFVLLMVSLAFKALTTYAQIRFSLMREYSIGKRLVELYLNQPYSWFLTRNSADLGKSIVSDVQTVINSGLMPLMTIIAQSTVAIALLILLLVVDPLLALSVGVVLGISYGAIFTTINGLIKHLGQRRVIANQQRFAALSEAFGASKEVKVGRLEDVFIQRFAKPAQTYAQGQATVQIISQLPRFLVEGIAIGGMLLVMLYFMLRSGGFAAALPVIALYAFAGYRLMPALQQIYSAFTQLRYVTPALNALHADLAGPCGTYQLDKNFATLSLTQSIALDKIVYRYPNSTQPSLKAISLNIPVKSTVGFVGTTGSGKTTLVDLILGLLEPQEGELRVDGQAVVSANRSQWQRCIGYVPQHIYLSDDTIAANIAFGVAPEYVNQQVVEHVAKIANLHCFVVNELQLGYATIVGERGVRLSGGQRQRIGIARALYHNPSVLIMDEATSALDNLTEQSVMEAVNKIGQGITIILIAHRLSTVKACDQIFLLEKGELKAQGTFDELAKTSESFRRMADHG